MTKAALRNIIQRLYSTGDALYTSSHGKDYRLRDYCYVPSTGKMSGKPCLRYTVPSRGGVDKRIPYEELLKLADYHRKHGRFPSHSQIRAMMPLACGDGGCCVRVAASVVQSLAGKTEVDGGKQALVSTHTALASRSPASHQRPEKAQSPPSQAVTQPQKPENATKLRVKSRGRRKIVLISCVKKKATRKAQVQDLYISDLFKSSLAYAKALNPDGIYVLSARYGLLALDEVIEPYELTLKKMSAAEGRLWAKKVVEQLAQRTDLQRDHFVFLAGQDYRKHLVPRVASYEIPMERLSFGQQLRFLKRQVAQS